MGIGNHTYIESRADWERKKFLQITIVNHAFFAFGVVK
ncbi:D-alanylalanine synthetase [Bacillus sp. NRRL B-14911]|uniref:Uncharacterized protein n=1 Tax=Bacillus infantis NRRL B-14911 TaxID=1367477 RepID=U5L697_9BACI|nr:hypothetical protein N288_01425 [Bacillus infantis NRRL B-14911]EAR64986.1 D-alanylalanine synthetase [Bacillus sp. NRRL B-14911]